MTLFRSSDGLTACPTCKRHINAAASPANTVCPFCTKMTPRSFRGGLLAASLITLAACGPSADPSAVPVPAPNEEMSAPAHGLAPTEEPPAEPEATPVVPEAVPEAANYEPASPMQAMARYGLAPIRRAQPSPD